MTPVPSHIVALAKEATPQDYPLKSSGLAVTIGSLIAENLQVMKIEMNFKGDLLVCTLSSRYLTTNGIILWLEYLDEILSSLPHSLWSVYT